MVDRDKVADVGVEVDDIGRTLETMLGGRQVTRVQRDGKQHDVIVQVEDAARAEPNDLTSIFVRNKSGQLIQLSNLVKVKEGVSAKELNHFNRQRAAIIQANVAPGHTLGEVLVSLDNIAKEVMGANFQTDVDGQSREFREASGTLVVTFLLALAFIYLVLAAQFESFLSPFVIMLTVPLAIAGALLFLYWSNSKLLVEFALMMGKDIPLQVVQSVGGTLNVYSQIGLVMLIGLITKHGILIVEFANQLQDKGMDKYNAVIEAATLRLRPILMTTAAMVLGAVPLVRATGAGAESRSPIGVVIVGGLLIGTLLTLFVIPTAYTLFVGQRRRTEDMADDHQPGNVPVMSLPERAAQGVMRNRVEPEIGAVTEPRVSMRRDD